MLYLYLLSIPYGHPFVKRYCFLSFLLAFHTELGSDILEKNAFFFDCNILRCTQKSPFSLHFLLRRWFPQCFPLLLLPKNSRSWHYHSNHLFYSYSPEYSAPAAAVDSSCLRIHSPDRNDAPGQLPAVSEARPYEVPLLPILHRDDRSSPIQQFFSNRHLI